MKPSESWRYTFPSNLFNSFVDPQLLNSNAKFQRDNSGGVLVHPLRKTCKKQYQQHVPPPWKLTLSIHIHWKLMLGWKMMINLFFKWVPFQRGFHFRLFVHGSGEKNPANPTQELARYDRSRQTPKPGGPSMKSWVFSPAKKNPENWLTTWDVWNPINNRINYQTSTGDR